MKKVKLGEVCEILNGFAFKSSLYVNEGIRIIRITNVQKGYIEDSDPKYYPIEYTNSIEKYILKENDLLMSLTGNVGRVGLISKTMLPAALNQRVACLRTIDSLISKEYVFQFLNSDLFEQSAIRSSNGVAQKNLSTDWLKKVEITYPSVEQQELITSTLNLIERLICCRKKQNKKFNELVKSRFNEMFGSKKFDKVSISELVDDRIETAKKIFDQHDTIKYIDISSIDNKNYKMTGFQEYMLDQAPSRAQQHIRKGDIVVSTVRPNLKNIAMTELDDENLVASSGFCVLRALKCLPEYLFAIICSDRFTNKMTNIVTGANYPAIKSSDIMNYIVPLPPIQLQNEFADFVDQVDKSQLAIQKSLDELETLKKSLMQEYFG